MGSSDSKHGKQPKRIVAGYGYVGTIALSLQMGA